MKAWMILMLVICVSMIVGQSEATKGRKYLSSRVINPCLRPNPPAGCHPHGSHHKPRVPVHKYRRGCTIINRCKRAT
ncbi:LOW QUALITY PROTEIN: protein RALF-like 26 [Eutrema salsugineum]|uniref:LOW QUALITY PROTEIN: protein RALF-like 26 n=1 Tax=Eutrema salsugineum TaxID=72664 RepID=UPI000CECEE76|nr:LOW QUALITY PROTEIN: protein RALF-like 26 [Eutrema salsugineum]